MLNGRWCILKNVSHHKKGKNIEPLSTNERPLKKRPNFNYEICFKELN
jgi:hypothetical protein